MKSDAVTVQDYLDSLPAGRREAISAVRELVNRKIKKGFREGLAYGMIAWAVPLEVYPDTYNGQPLIYAALANQKQYMAIYLMTVYGDPQSQHDFRDAFGQAGKRLDMGKSCVRFRKLEDLHLPAIARAIGRCTMAEYVRRAKTARETSGERRQKPVAAATSPAPRAKKKPAAPKAASAPRAKKAAR